MGELACGLGVINTSGVLEGIRYNKSATALWDDNMELLRGGGAPDGTDYNEWDQIVTDAPGLQDTVQQDDLNFTLRVPTSGVSGVCTGTTRITVKTNE